MSMTSTDSSRPNGLLSGLRVLELGNFIAAPFATKILADFGAEVIKVERPVTGDELRQWRTPEGVTSMLFRSVARNKKSVTLDLRTSEGRQLALELASRCDLVFENFRPGTLERWGLGPKDLAAVNPSTILVRISGYGQTGPYRDRAGFGSVAESVGGLRYVTGEPDRPAARAAASLGDTVSGLYSIIGALMLLWNRTQRDQCGGADPVTEVETVDVALYESVFSILESLVADFDAYGIVRERTGGSLPGVVPTGSYPCADGDDVVIGANSDGLFARMLSVMGRADLAGDPAYQGGPARSAKELELDTLIRHWTAQHTVAEVVSALNAEGVPAAAVYDARGIVADPHYAARGMHQTFDVPTPAGVASVRFPGVVPHIPSAPGQVRDAGPEIGEHNTDILGELLGHDDDELADLREREII